MQPIPVHHQHPHHHSQQQPHLSNGHPQGSDSSAYGYFGPNGSSPPMPTPTPRAHSSMSHPHGGQPSRRPASLYNIGSYGHLMQTQQLQQQHQPQQKSSFQPQQSAAGGSHSGYASSHGQPPQQHGHGHGHGHSRSGSNYGMDIILPSSSSSSQRPVLPPPISTLAPRRPGHSMEDYEESRRSGRHERTMSEGHPAGYLSPTMMASPTSPPPERHAVDNGPYRDEYEPDSPSSATQSSPFANGASSTTGTANNRHSTSLSSFGMSTAIKPEDVEPKVVLREPRPSATGNHYPGNKNRRSYDDALYDEHQQLMRDNFNMDKRLVISEDEPRPESAIDLLAYAAAFIQESEEHKKDGSVSSAGAGAGARSDHGASNSDDKRVSLGQLNSSNKRQSFHGPSGYPSKEPFFEDSSRYSSSSMSWEPSGTSASANPSGDIMPVPRQRNRDGDGAYAPRRPRPVTYGGSGFLYDHHENQFMPQSMSPSLSSSPGGYSRSPSSSARRVSSHRNSTEVGSSGLLLQRGLTRPRRSSSTATQQNPFPQPNPQFYSQTPPHQQQQPVVLAPIMGENQRLLSPAMVPSPPPFSSSTSSGPPQLAANRLSRHDSYGSNSGGFPTGTSQGNGHASYPPRDSPGSDSYSRESFNDSRGSREDFEEEGSHKDHGRVEELDEDMEDEDEYHRQRAAKRRSGNFFATALQ